MKLKYAVIFPAAALALALAFSGVTAAYAEDNAAGGAHDAAASDNETLARQKFMMGMMMVNHKNYAKAVQNFEEALRLNPNHYETYLLLGKTYTRVNRHKESEETIRKAIKLDPSRSDAYDDLMVLLLYLKRPADAAKVGEQALAAGVDPAKVPDLGWSYYQADMLDKAEARYLADLDAYPNAFGTLRNLGILYHDRGEYEKALEYYIRAELVDPENARLPYLKALTYLKLDREDDVRKELTVAKSRIRGLSNKYRAFNDLYFPHNDDPGNLWSYIYMVNLPEDSEGMTEEKTGSGSD